MSKGPLVNPNRRQAYSVLFGIGSIIHEDLHLDEFNITNDNELEKLDNVRIEPLVLDEASPQRPSYFACYPNHLLPEPSGEEFEDMKKNATFIGGGDDDPEDPDSRPVYRACQVYRFGFSIYMQYFYFEAKEGKAPWAIKPVRGCVFDTVKGLYRYEQPEYGCFNVMDSYDSAFPHVKAVMFSSMAPSDSTILYGELFPILIMMLTQFRRPRFSHHLITPVLMFSLRGTKIRVIEAFQRDRKLTLRVTPFYEFRHGNHNGFMALTRWCYGKPIGETTLASFGL